MDRRERRFRALIRRAADRCTLCRKPFGTNTYTGKRAGRAEYVGECCVDRLDLIDGVGIFVKRDPEPAYKCDDGEWFANNPTRSHRLRPASVDEADEAWVIVRQIEPGTRRRLIFTCDRDLPDDETFAHILFDLIVEARSAGHAGISASSISARLAAVSEDGRA
jgi:hypothetical protein